MEIVDNVLDALERRDAEALVGLVHYMRIGCVKRQRGLGAPPLCRPDEPEGKPVRALPGGSCHGWYSRPPAVPRTMRHLVRGDLHLYGILLRSDDFDQPTWPLGQFLVIFHGGLQMALDRGGIVSIHHGCGGTAQQLFERPAGTPILPPPIESTDPTARRLGSRPLTLHAFRPGNRCPVTPPKTSDDSTGVTLAFDRPNQVQFSFARPSHLAWAGLKAGIAVTAGYNGPALLRGGRIDGPGELRFGGGREPRRFLLLPESVPLCPGGRTVLAAQLRFRTAGCYALQVDTDAGSRVIVFRAFPRHPSRPIGLGSTIRVWAWGDGPFSGSCVRLMPRMISVSHLGEVEGSPVECKFDARTRTRLGFTRDRDVFYLTAVQTLLLGNGRLPKRLGAAACADLVRYLLSPEEDPGAAAYKFVCSSEPAPRTKRWLRGRVVWGLIPGGERRDRPEETPCWRLARAFPPHEEGHSVPALCTISPPAWP